MTRSVITIALVALAALVAGQEGAPSAVASSQLPSALPAVSSPEGSACGGCYVVADVAGIVFGGIATATATHVVSVGNNGSLVTTSIVENQGQVTFTNSEPVAGAPTSFNPLSSVITVNGATLTSPTSYEVFTAYSVITTVSGASGCSVSTMSPSILAQASKYAVPEDAGSDFLLSIESQFIAAIGFPECSAGGGTVQSTTHSMVTTKTTTTTTTGGFRPTPVPLSSAAASTTFNYPNISQAAPTIVPATGVASSQQPNFSIAMAFVMIAAGAFAILL